MGEGQERHRKAAALASCLAPLSSSRCLVRVHLVPKARKVGILGVHGQALKVAVGAPPEKGQANRELLQLLAGLLGVARSQLRLAWGEASRQKGVEVPLPLEAVVAALTQAVD